MGKLHPKVHPLTRVFNKTWLSANSLAISRELAAYYSLEIIPVFTINMRNICCRTQTLDRQSFVLEKPNNLAPIILSSFHHSMIKAKHAAEQPCIQPKPWSLGTKAAQCLRKFPHILSMYSKVKQSSQRMLLDLIQPREECKEKRQVKCPLFFSMIMLKHLFLKKRCIIHIYEGNKKNGVFFCFH